MARLLFPDAASIDRVQATAGTSLLSASGATARVYLDEAGTQLADILNADGSANATATLVLDNLSRLPTFQGPTSGVDELYVRVDGGGPVKVDATIAARLAVQDGQVLEQLADQDLAVAGQLAAHDAAVADQLAAQDSAVGGQLAAQDQAVTEQLAAQDAAVASQLASKLDSTAAASKYGVVVAHGAGAGTARPDTPLPVLWDGTVAPSNRALNDRWYDQVTDLVKRWDGVRWVGAGSRTFAERAEAAQALTITMPQVRALLRTHNDATPTTLRIGSLGSSVGVGATLPDASTQSPSARLAAVIGPILAPLGNVPITHTNGCVNGTTIISGRTTDYAALKVAAGGAIKLLILIYGMNDGTSAQYHAGQTYPGVYNEGARLIREARADGADVIIITSPHPHTGRQSWTMPGGVSVSYPAASNQVPDATLAQSVRTHTLPDGRTVPISYRHLRVNQALRQLGVDFGCTVLDAERHWFEAVADLGEDALFNVGESVHPNLLGHQRSYWRAIDDLALALRKATTSVGVPPLLRGKVGLNVALPLAGLHHVNPSYGEPVLRLDRATNPADGVAGPRALQVDDDGTLNYDGSIVQPSTASQTLGKTVRTQAASNNVAAAATRVLVSLASTEHATVTVTGHQSGVGTYTAKYLVQRSFAGVTRYATISTVGEVDVFTPSVSGTDFLITIGFANTNLRWSVDRMAA